MIAHIAVLLTLLIIIGLIKPLTGAIGRGDSAAVAPVATMLVLGVLPWCLLFELSPRASTRLIGFNATFWRPHRPQGTCVGHCASFGAMWVLQ